MNLGRFAIHGDVVVPSSVIGGDTVDNGFHHGAIVVINILRTGQGFHAAQGALPLDSIANSSSQGVEALDIASDSFE